MFFKQMIETKEWKNPVFALWLMLLTTVSVDHSLSFDVSNYTLKLTYLFSVVLVFSIWIKSKKLHLDYVKSFPVVEILIFTCLSIISSFFSESIFRSTVFTLWGAATMLGIPYLFFSLQRTIPRHWIRNTILLYIFIQSVVIIVDFFIGNLSLGLLSIAKTQVYYSHARVITDFPVDWDTWLKELKYVFSRPTAWYQEPGYFCAFALPFFAYLCTVQKNSYEKIFFGVIGLALIFSTSRMGWIGFFYSLLFFIATRKELFLCELKKNKKFLLILFFLFSMISILSYETFYNFILKGFINPSDDASFITRQNSLIYSWNVFVENPWFGSGAGMATFEANKLFNLKISDHLPLAQNLYTEILSERGILGLLSFFFCLWRIFRPLKNSLFYFGAFLIIYLSTQTLARYDLWFAISFLYFFSPLKSSNTLNH